MTSVVFSTPGLLDLKAITTFGVNAKPNTKNPIGFFGTGLKYAIAVLVRNKIPLTIFIGSHQYDFYVKDIEFRDKGFGQVMYKARSGLIAKWRYVDLPFTTELGKHWDLWQAFRELESNTRDEGGETYQTDLPNSFHGHPDRTYIVVGGEDFSQVYADRDKIFLPEGLTTYEYTEWLQVIKQPSNSLYFRGLRVQDLEKPSMFTYNILRQVELTEDRTVKYPFVTNMSIAHWVTQSKDPEIVSKILSANPEKFYEGKLDFDSVSTSPNEVFMTVMRKKKARDGSILPRASAYYSRYEYDEDSEEFKELKYHSRLTDWLEKNTGRLEQEDVDFLHEIQAILERHDE